MKGVEETTNSGRLTKLTASGAICVDSIMENGHSFKDVRPDRLLFVRRNYPVDREK